MRRAAVFSLSLLGVAITGTAVADFHIEYPASITSSERGLMGNRTHYEQKGEANFRMTDADRKPEQSKYTEAGHKMVVDLGYRVVTHHGTANNEFRVRTFADDVPLLRALALVVPKGWQAYQHVGLDADRLQELVSFEGNLLWTDALHSIGDRFGYQFHVDWYERSVLISQGRITTEQEASKVKVIHEPPPADAQPAGNWFTRTFGKRKAAAPAPVVTSAPIVKPAPAIASPAPVEPVEVVEQPVVQQEEPCVCVHPSQVKKEAVQTSWQTRTAKTVGDDSGIKAFENKHESGSFRKTVIQGIPEN